MTDTEIASRFVEVLAAPDTPGELFADDLFCDLNVPEWRFQMQGVADFLKWTASEIAGYTIELGRVVRTENGFWCETVARGASYSRNSWLVEVRDGRIAALTFYCTGEWDAETVERQAREAPMLRP